MSKEFLGIIGGQKIYVETGVDQTKILLDEIKKKVEEKKLKAGQRFIMAVQFDEPLVAVINIERLQDNER